MIPVGWPELLDRSMAKRTPKKRKPQPAADECVIPPAIPKGELRQFVLGDHENDVRSITEYVEWQCRGEEKVLHAERVATERDPKHPSPTRLSGLGISNFTPFPHSQLMNEMTFVRFLPTR